MSQLLRPLLFHRDIHPQDKRLFWFVFLLTSGLLITYDILRYQSGLAMDYTHYNSDQQIWIHQVFCKIYPGLIDDAITTGWGAEHGHAFLAIYGFFIKAFEGLLGWDYIMTTLVLSTAVRLLCLHAILFLCYRVRPSLPFLAFVGVLAAAKHVKFDAAMGLPPGNFVAHDFGYLAIPLCFYWYLRGHKDPTAWTLSYVVAGAVGALHPIYTLLLFMGMGTTDLFTYGLTHRGFLGRAALGCMVAAGVAYMAGYFSIAGSTTIYPDTIPTEEISREIALTIYGYFEGTDIVGRFLTYPLTWFSLGTLVLLSLNLIKLNEHRRILGLLCTYLACFVFGAILGSSWFSELTGSYKGGRFVGVLFGFHKEYQFLHFWWILGAAATAFGLLEALTYQVLGKRWWITLVLIAVALGGGYRSSRWFIKEESTNILTEMRTRLKTREIDFNGYYVFPPNSDTGVGLAIATGRRIYNGRFMLWKAFTERGPAIRNRYANVRALYGKNSTPEQKLEAIARIQDEVGEDLLVFWQGRVRPDFTQSEPVYSTSFYGEPHQFYLFKLKR